MPRAVVGRTSVGFGRNERPARQAERVRLVVGVVEATGPGWLVVKQTPGWLVVKQTPGWLVVKQPPGWLVVKRSPGRQTCAFAPASGSTASETTWHRTCKSRVRDNAQRRARYVVLPTRGTG